MQLSSLYKLAESYMPYFNAIEVSVSLSQSKHGQTYYIGFWKESLDKPGTTYIDKSFMSNTHEKLLSDIEADLKTAVE